MIFDEFSIKTLIRPVPDFPKPGVIFRDITPLFQSPRALRMVADSFIQRYVEAEFSHIGAMDARGFLIGSIIAYELNKPLVLFRKQGKLPADVLSEGYQTEYGEAFLEVHSDSLCEGDSVLIFDDLIATGGTLIAAAASSPPAIVCGCVVWSHGCGRVVARAQLEQSARKRRGWRVGRQEGGVSGGRGGGGSGAEGDGMCLL